MQVVVDAIADSQDWMVHVTTRRAVTRAEYLAFCETNPDLRIERSAEGELIVMAPAHSRSGSQNAALTSQLFVWAQRDGTGLVFDSSAGFDLPNGSNRSPDASWVLKSRIETLKSEERNEFLAICPDFVAELRSSSDRLSVLQAKMREYLACGARVGWLIDPLERRVWVYQSGKAVERLDEPESISAEPFMPGFILDLALIWNPPV